MFVSVGQREQEVVAVSAISRTTPIGDSVTTDQSFGRLTTIQVHNCNGRTFAIAQTVECRRTATINTALVTQEPVLVGRTRPTVNLYHLRGIQ
jgi:hypothetical protein